MNEAIAFAKWISRKGWQQYDGDDRWICLNGTRTVCSTERLYEKFKGEQEEKDASDRQIIEQTFKIEPT